MPHEKSDKKKGRDKMLDDFNTGFLKSMREENEEIAKAPKVNDAAKGEYLREPNPADEH